jgi:CRP/FNR family transcriptional regulator, anaerobic regulatory protein
MINGEDIDLLKRCIPFYAHLIPEEQNQLKLAISYKQLAKGDQLTGIKDNCSGFFMMKSGRIRVFILSAEGKEITLFRLLENDVCILSASCIFKNVHFTIYLDVEKDSSIYLIPSIVMDQLSHKNLYVKEYLLEQMSSRFSCAMWVMEQVVFGSLSKRVANFILEQTLLEKGPNLSITHDAIARNIGSAREVVSRMLKYFEKENIIGMSRGSIHVNDLEKLKMLAQ